MKNLLLALVILCAAALNAQDNSHGPQSLRCAKDFIRAGWDTSRHSIGSPAAILHMHAAESNFKASKGLLAGGIASVVLGSGALLTGTLGANQSAAIRPYRTPLIITAAALNVVVMPVCFVIRDVMTKKANKHVRAALALNP